MIFFRLLVLASRLGGGDDSKRKASMLEHKENLRYHEHLIMNRSLMDGRPSERGDDTLIPSSVV